MQDQKIKLGKFGMVDIEYPKSISILLDIVFEQSSTNGNRARFGRLAAASIGVLCPSIHPPKYSLMDCDPMMYGATMQDWLLKNDVPLADIITAGSKCLVLAGSKYHQTMRSKKGKIFHRIKRSHPKNNIGY